MRQLRLLAVALACVLAPAGAPGAVRRRLLSRQAGQPLYRLLGRRHLRRLCPRDRAPPRPSHPRQSERHPAQHGGRRQPAASPTTSTRSRRATAPRSPPSDAPRWRRRCSRSRPRTTTRASSPGSAAPTTRSAICAAWHTSGITQLRRPQDQGIRLRRDRPDRGGGADLQGDERAVRHQDPHGVGLSRRQPDQPRDRARRDSTAAARCRGRA